MIYKTIRAIKDLLRRFARLIRLYKAIKAIKVLPLRGGLSAMLRHGVAASVEHVNVLGDLGCSTIVDIGANRGQFALAVRHCFPEARIFSFEPLPAPVRKFRQVFASDPRVTLYPVAIGPETAEATIHVSAQDGSSSLLPITPAQERLFPGTAETETRSIQVGRLVDFLSEPDITPPALLKLDVQGYELSAIQGCEELLHCFTWVYAECSFVELYENQALADEVIDRLRKHRFRLRGIYNVTYDKTGRLVQADFLFEQ